MDKVYSLLGLARKAGSLKIGEMGCTEAIKKKKCSLLIIAEDASSNTEKKFVNLSNRYSNSYIKFSNKEKIGNAVGKGNISVIAILDSNFSRPILELLKSNHL